MFRLRPRVIRRMWWKGDVWTCVRPVFGAAQSASLPENRPSRYARVFLVGPSWLGSSTLGRGGLRTPATRVTARPTHVPDRPQASRLVVGWKWNTSALARPYHAGAQSAPLRENHPARYPRDFHREAISLWITHPGAAILVPYRCEGLVDEFPLPEAGRRQRAHI